MAGKLDSARSIAPVHAHGGMSKARAEIAEFPAKRRYRVLDAGDLRVLRSEQLAELPSMKPYSGVPTPETRNPSPRKPKNQRKN